MLRWVMLDVILASPSPLCTLHNRLFFPGRLHRWMKENISAPLNGITAAVLFTAAALFAAANFECYGG